MPHNGELSQLEIKYPLYTETLRIPTRAELIDKLREIMDEGAFIMFSVRPLNTEESP